MGEVHNNATLKAAKMKNPTCNPETNKMFAELAQAVRESFDYPNAMIQNPNLRDDRSKTTSLQYIHKHYEAEFERETEHAKLKAEKARRVAAYAAQLEIDPNDPNEAVTPFEYEVDERKLNNKQLDFCAAAVGAGWMEFDDEE